MKSTHMAIDLPDNVLDNIFRMSRNYNFRGVCKHWLNIRHFEDLLMDKYNCDSTILRKAIKGGDRNICKKLLARITTTKFSPELFLFLAIREGHLDICKMLMKQEWKYVLMYNCLVFDEEDNFKEVECFSDYSLMLYMNDAFRIAVDKKQVAICDYLLDEYKNELYIEQDDLFAELMKISKRGDFDLCKLLLDNITYSIHSLSWALIYASTNNHRDICQLLFQKGAQPSYSNSKSLQYASKNGHFDICLFLTTTSEFRASPCHDNSASLRFAAEKGYYNICEYLTNRTIFGRSVAKPQKMNSQALVLAVHGGFTDIVRLLIDRGAKPLAQNSICLRTAASANNLEMCKLLVSKGASPQQVTIYSDEIVEFFKQEIDKTRMS